VKASLFGGFVFLVAVCGFAQKPTRIDGRTHPELIPDNAAYRAVFLMHSHFAAPEETVRSEQFHARLALTAGDHEAYDQILKDFRLQYENLVQAHNAFVDSGSSVIVASLRDEMTGFKVHLRYDILFWSAHHQLD
jgi:hypothetical protein